MLVGSRSEAGTITLSGPAPAGGLVVTLSSDSPTSVRVPGRVMVPAGATMASFTVATSRVRATTPVVISATFGGATQTATLTVVPVGIATFLLHPIRVRGSQTAIGEIALHAPAPANGAIIILTSDDPAVASPPASITVPAGARSIRFPIPTHRISASRLVAIRATYGGVTQVAGLTVIRR